jgi:AcrR family transcriptional regulator
MVRREPSHVPIAPTVRGNEKVGAIIVEARKQLIEKGVSRFSSRAVAQTLGLRLYNVQHYFPSTEALLRAALENAIVSFDAEIEEFLRTQHKTNAPETALRESLRYFLRMNERRWVRFFFFEMAAAAQHDAVIEGMLSDLYGEYLARISVLVSAANPALSRRELDRRTELIAFTIEGTMLVLPARSGNNHRRKSEDARVDYLVELACK